MVEALVMADSMPPSARSTLMARIRGRNTQPELAVRRMLFARGWRYRLHAPHLPGRPDIVFPGRRAAIFVHGCFWHGHHRCPRATVPKTRTTFWCDKIAANQRRDARQARALRRMGWSVLTVWQCQTTDEASLTSRIERFLMKHSCGSRENRTRKLSPDSA